MYWGSLWSSTCNYCTSELLSARDDPAFGTAFIELLYKRAKENFSKAENIISKVYNFPKIHIKKKLHKSAFVVGGSVPI